MFAAQERLIAIHGGLGGVRDRGMLESAMARPEHLANYGEPDAAELAAAYAFGLVRNHGFVDGNKRVGWLMAEVFLVRNGYLFVCDAPSLILEVERLAAGAIDQSQLADWIRARLRKG
jgi:death-on-curing protein